MKTPLPLTLARVLGPILIGICGSISDAAYEIRPGDTLTKIAVAKYGNIEKWKEIFELNKPMIKDPHWIYPGQRLRLMAEEKLTFVASAGAPPKFRKRSQEWRLLPKQTWERFIFAKDPLIDPSGFDKRSSTGKRFSNQTLPLMSIAQDRIPISGEITGSRSDFNQISLGETTLIRADESIQVGTTYSVTPGPEKLSSSRDGRVGFAYPIYGKIKVIGVRDGMFIGTVINVYHPISRGNLLIPMVNSIRIPKPMACPSPILASAMMIKQQRYRFSGQAKTFFMDVGSQDGVQPGMIFRQYMNTDPYTKSRFPTRDFMIESEVMVISTQEQFSIGLVLESRSGVRDEDELVGLTDLKDFDRNQGLQSVLQDHAPGPGMDELDKLDTTDGLGEKEIKELNQLENWSKQTPSEGTGAGLPEEEIKREVINPSSNPIKGIGEEAAPNDASGTGIPATPTTAPESSAPPEPVLVTPTPTPEPPAAAPSGTGDEVQSEAVPQPPSIDSALDGPPVTP